MQIFCRLLLFRVNFLTIELWTQNGIPEVNVTLFTSCFIGVFMRLKHWAIMTHDTFQQVVLFLSTPSDVHSCVFRTVTSSRWSFTCCLNRGGYSDLTCQIKEHQNYTYCLNCVKIWIDSKVTKNNLHNSVMGLEVCYK